MCITHSFVLHTKPKLAARRRSRVGRRQPGKLQARPYFVLSCCFSTRRKEMSEQTRHATPNLLISIHILWLLISSLLHSLSLPSPCPSPPFPASALSRRFSLRLALCRYISRLTSSPPSWSPFLQFFSFPLADSRHPFLSLFLIVSAFFSRLLPSLLSFSLFHLSSNILL